MKVVSPKKGKTLILKQTRVKQNNDHIQIMPKIRFRSSFYYL